MAETGEKEPLTGVLRADVEVVRSGGGTMLFDRQADAYYHVSEEMLELVQYLTVPMKLDAFVAKTGGSREEIVQLLAFLRQNNLLEPQYGEVGQKREKAMEMREKTAFLRFSAAYLFFKLPPIRPERLYAKLAPYVSWMCSRTVVLALAVPAVLGYLMLCREATAVRATFVDSLSWAGLVRYFGAIVFLKFVHESAHSLAAMHFGCRVRGVGLGFMVFYPRFFTDTTDAWRLPRRSRLLIDGAGILIELLLGGIAALLWVYAAPGVWKSTLFYVFAVSTISTLFVNGNPCIRYDGYYILSDLVGIPNLMMRSADYVKRWWRYRLLRLGEKPEGEHGRFLLVFGICSFIYRIFLYTSIILVIYHKFVKALALVMMVLELYSILIYPFWRECQTIRALSKKSASKARWILSGCVLGFFALILFLPLGWDVELYGEVSTENRELIVAEEGGYLVAPLSVNPRSVAAGEEICRLESPALRAMRDRLSAETEVDRLARHYASIDAEQFVEVGVMDEKLRSDQVACAEVERRLGRLRILARRSGIFLPAAHEDLSAGAFIPRGMKLGEVLQGEPRVVGYVRETAVGKLAVGDPATLRLADRLATFPATVTEIDQLPGRLPPSALLQPFGGPIPVYYEPSSDNKTFCPVETLYRVMLKPASDAVPADGRLVKISIPHREMFWSRVKAYLLSSFHREF